VIELKLKIRKKDKAKQVKFFILDFYFFIAIYFLFFRALLFLWPGQ